MEYSGPSYGTSDQTLIESWNGAVWSIIPSPSPGSSGLSGVSCLRATRCTAVGDTDNTSFNSSNTLVELWNGTEWSVATTPEASGTLASQLDGISCLNQTCTAVGYGFGGGADGAPWQSLVETAPIPSVSSVSPHSGPTTGGTAITITGTGFANVATVSVGQRYGSTPIAATKVKVVSPTKITAVTGGGAKTGTWDVFVATSGGTSAANAGDHFTYH